MKFIVVVLLLGLTPAFGQIPFSRNVAERAQNLAPYVTSPQPIVDLMLDMAKIKQGETVYDLGCGDGRILITAAQRFKAKGIGVELSESLVRTTTDKVKQLNLQDQIKVMHANLLDVPLNSADVVVIYLETLSNEKLRPNLERDLKPGSRVVSHDFEVRGWKPSRVEKIHSHRRSHTIYLYEMPPKK